MRQKNLYSLLLVFFSFFLSISISCGEETETVKIAILPCNDVVKTFERFKPLTEYLESVTGLTVQAVFPEDEEGLIRIFRKRGVDFIFHSPSGFAKIADKSDTQSLLKALGPDGKDYEIGYMVVRKDSGLKTFQDLKGKTVIFGMECSASRWLSAKNIFVENGMDIEKDLGSFTDGGCCEDISFNVFLKAADAGLVCQHYFEDQKKLGAIHIEALAIIGESSPIPTRIFAAHKDTPRDRIDQIQKALSAIDLHNPRFINLVTTTEIGGFVKAEPAAYK
jgi:phosphonate transport system substrate-binding protein